jgi:hypothetical protein
MCRQIFRPIQRENVHLHTDMYYYSISAVCNDVGGNNLTLALHFSKQYVSKHVIMFHFLHNPIVFHSVDLKNHKFLVCKTYALCSEVTVLNLGPRMNFLTAK